MTMHTPSSPIEILEQKRLAVAKTNGFALFLIGPDKNTPGFVYSTGMAQHQLPEILAFFPGSTENGREVCNVVDHICEMLLAASTHIAPITLIKAMISSPLQMGEPDSQFTFKFLGGDDCSHALNVYLTRATLFRQELGLPVGVLTMHHPDVPSFQHIRAQRMLDRS